MFQKEEMDERVNKVRKKLWINRVINWFVPLLLLKPKLKAAIASHTSISPSFKPSYSISRKSKTSTPEVTIQAFYK